MDNWLTDAAHLGTAFFDGTLDTGGYYRLLVNGSAAGGRADDLPVNA